MTSESRVVGVSRDGRHRFSKPSCDEIRLVEGLGVEGDAHAGVTVQHRSRVAKDPTRPNLRQVHLIAEEFLAEARGEGFEVGQGDLGENVLTTGLDLLALSRDSMLHIGDQAQVRVTGLRNPCRQINAFRGGLLKVAITRDDGGGIVRRAGVMGVVERGGVVRPGDPIRVATPVGAHVPLECV